MPKDTPAATKPNPPADDATRVGWFLTAITGIVVLVGLAVINYVTGSKPRPEVIVPAVADAPKRLDEATLAPPPIVLRPADEPVIEVADESRSVLR